MPLRNQYFYLNRVGLFSLYQVRVSLLILAVSLAPMILFAKTVRFGTKVEEGQTWYVYEKAATLWSSMDPGFTYKDCEEPEGKATEVCSRRQAWPLGGTPLKVVRPIQRTRINGEYLVLVKVGDVWGWANTKSMSPRYIEAQNAKFDPKSFFQDSRVYLNPNVDVRVCEAKPRTQGCNDYIAVPKGTAIRRFAPFAVKSKDNEYLMVDYSDESKGIKKSGWVNIESLAPIPLNPRRPKKKESLAKALHLPDLFSKPHQCSKADCSPTNSSTDQQIEDLFDAIKDSAGLVAYKNSAQLEKFACFHSKAEIYPKGFSFERFCSHYAGKNKFRDSIKKAAEAFELPESLIGCTLLNESGLYFNPDENDAYPGYAQFGRPAVDDLKKKLERSPYKEMWKSYAGKREKDFTDHYIRKTADAEIATGAAALFMKWLLTDQIPRLSACKDCSKNNVQPNRKDVFLATAGYDWSPYGLRKIADKTPDELLELDELPEETRDYFKKIERCLEPNQFENFISDSGADAYASRKGMCDKPCP